MTSKSVPTVVKVARIANLLSIAGLCFMSVLLIVGGFFGGTKSVDTGTRVAVFFMMAIIGVIFFLPAYLLIRLNKGLLDLKPWARKWQIALSCLGVIAFPVGTILYGYVLLRLLSNKAVKEAFSEPVTGS